MTGNEFRTKRLRAKPRRLITLKRTGKSSVRKTRGLHHDTTPKTKAAAERKKASQFKEGNKPTNRNHGPIKITLLLKDAIVRAAELAGYDGKGRDELLGYLKRLAIKEPKAYAGLLGRVLPYHITARNDHYHFHTREDVIAALRERGLPVDAIFDDVPRLPAPLQGTDLAHDLGLGDDDEDTRH